MAKKRTREQKSKARSHFLEQHLRDSIASHGELVKREFVVKAKRSLGEAKKLKRPNILAKESDTGLIKRDIVKSLVLASLILILTAVIYFAWR